MTPFIDRALVHSWHPRCLVIVGLVFLLAWAGVVYSRRSEPVRAATLFTTITVTTTADEDGTNPAKCSLREAIKAANTNSSYGGCPGGVVFAPDSIVFDLGFGAATINLASELPTISGPVFIDGATGSSTSITLNGVSAGANTAGLIFNAGSQGSTVSALGIKNFGSSGIGVAGTSGITIQNCLISNNLFGIFVSNNTDGNFIGVGAGTGNTIIGNRSYGIFLAGSNNVVQGNFIGTDSLGTPSGNSDGGIFLANGQQNQIGGAAAGAGNVISGNGQDGIHILPFGSATPAVTGTSIKGNLIGTTPDGTAALGNSFSGIAIIGPTATGNSIGGTEAGARNIVSGNGTQGIYLNAPSNTLQGNYIGTKADGVSALANGANGVQISGVSNNTIGGTAAGAGNLISGNTLDGINISGSVTGTFIKGNLIGLKADGMSELGNLVSGVAIIGANATNNLIGGSEAGARNVISGNGTRGVYLNAPGNSVRGNYIGPNADGLTAPVLNQNDGVVIESSGVQTVNAINNRIGGIGPSDRNLISGNGFSGITIKDAASSGNRVDANYIGMNVNGTAAIAGTLIGVLINGAPATTIGSLNRSQGNLISGNLEIGVAIQGNTASNNEVVGNYIGTTANGTAAIPIVGINSRGISIGNGAQNNLIGSSVFGAGNIISGHAKDGIVLSSDNNRIEGNYIGTDVTGMAAIPNGNNGIYISDNASSNQIGGSGTQLRNIISGNTQHGIRVESGSNNQIYGNFIGLKSDGISALGNTLDGIFISTQLTYVGNTGGADNTIAFNGRNGITVTGNDGASGNFITVNSIHSNGALGIDLAPLDAMNNPVFGFTPNDTGDSDSGPNHLANYPVLTSAVGYSAGANTIARIKGMLNTTSNNMGRVLFFLNPNCDPSGFGEGKTYLGDSGFITANTSGNLSLDVTLTGLPISFNAGDSVTAVYLWGNNSTSEFSACIPLLAPQLTINDVSANEENSGNAPANFTVTLTGAIGVLDPIMVNYATANGTATAGSDYIATNGTLSFNPPFTQNTVTQTIPIQILGDTTPEPNETFFVNLTANVNATLTKSQGAGTILNDDCATITVLPSALIDPPAGQPYTQILTASGGGAPYSFMISAGALPNGLTLTMDGTISGTPPQSGIFNFTVKATDTNNCMGTRAYSVTVTGGNGLQFYPLSSPVRLLDTRLSATVGCVKNTGPFVNNETRSLAARTACSTIPANATAVIGNITVVPSGPGFLTLFPSDAAQPTVANSNFKAGEVTNNFFTVGLGASGVDAGAFKIFTSLFNAGTNSEVIIDVTGYYAPPGTGGLYYHALPAPVRLLQTFPGQTGCILNNSQQLQGLNDPNANPSLDLTIQGRGATLPSPCNGIPNDAVVLVGNATTVFPNAPFGFGYLTIYPSDATRPTVASSNYNNNDIINGPFAVKLGTDGKFKVYTFSTTHLVIDISAYYSTSANDANGAGLLFNPLPKPMRLLETRDIPGFTLTGCYQPKAPIPAGTGGIRTQPAWGACADQLPLAIPTTARALVGNVSVLNPAGAGFGTFFPGDVGTAPTVATTNYPFPVVFGYNRHYYVGLSPVDGTFKILTQFTSDYIVDVSGYFAP